MDSPKNLTYPICFKEFKISKKRNYQHYKYLINNFYLDNRFSPSPFYKHIIKL
jgi:hypothetical protein